MNQLNIMSIRHIEWLKKTPLRSEEVHRFLDRKPPRTIPEFIQKEIIKNTLNFRYGKLV